MKKLVVIILVLFAAETVVAQTGPAFWNEIVAYKKTDSAQPPQKNAILFVGSSSFRLWKDVSDYFPNYTIINRGVGGATLPDIIRYSYDIILPYQPKQVVIYCGENDMASGEVKADEVLLRFKTLYGIIRQNLPQAHIHFVSMKPSPSRSNVFNEVKKGNDLIKAFLEKEKKAGFIDIWNPMLDATGKPKEELFIEDRLHMNASGYAIWKKAIQPYLVK